MTGTKKVVLTMGVWPAVVAIALLSGALWRGLAIGAPGILHDQESVFGRVIVKEDEAGFRTLHFGGIDGARQSVVKPGDPAHLELPYAKTAMAGLTLAARVERVLIVGLGGGTLPSFLRHHYPKAEIDAVDIDPEVIKVAKAYFDFREDAAMRAHLGDGRAFIEAVKRPYDVIFLDAFGSDSVPERLTTLEFLRAVRRAVTPDGVVIGNIWGPYANRLYYSMVKTYRAGFSDVVVVDAQGAGNRIVLALPRRGGIQRAQLISNSRKLSSDLGFRFDAGAFVEFGYAREPERPELGNVLRDRNLGR